MPYDLHVLNLHQYEFSMLSLIGQNALHVNVFVIIQFKCIAMRWIHEVSCVYHGDCQIANNSVENVTAFQTSKEEWDDAASRRKTVRNYQHRRNKWRTKNNIFIVAS